MEVLYLEEFGGSLLQEDSTSTEIEEVGGVGTLVDATAATDGQVP